MGKTSNLEENLSAKGKKAHRRLEATNCEIELLNVYLKKISDILTELTGDSAGLIEKAARRGSSAYKKKRSMVQETPPRIEFIQSKLGFYIDFTLVVTEGDDSTSIIGSIIYGANRPLCFSECIFPKNTKTCRLCERIARCDALEDKPLIQFSINKHGMIKSGRELEDEWWIEDLSIPKSKTKEEKEEEEEKNKKALKDFHYRALAHIWKDALDWTNENLLP